MRSATENPRGAVDFPNPDCRPRCLGSKAVSPPLRKDSPSLILRRADDRSLLSHPGPIARSASLERSKRRPANTLMPGKVIAEGEPARKLVSLTTIARRPPDNDPPATDYRSVSCNGNISPAAVCADFFPAHASPTSSASPQPQCTSLRHRRQSCSLPEEPAAFLQNPDPARGNWRLGTNHTISPRAFSLSSRVLAPSAHTNPIANKALPNHAAKASHRGASAPSSEHDLPDSSDLIRLVP